MYRRRIIVIVAIILVCSLVMALVTFLSIRKENGNFDRSFVANPEVIDTLSMPNNHFYLAGKISDTLFFGAIDQPNRLFYWRLGSPHFLGSRNLSVANLTERTLVTVKRDGYYLAGLESFRLFSGQDSLLHEIVKRPAYFSSVVPLSKSSYVIKTIDTVKRESVLAIEASYRKTLLAAPWVLQKQIDGIFCTDGMLMFNRQLNKVIYLYYYRNQFMVMDTTLKVIYRGNTIDSTAHANIKVVENKFTNEIVLGSPPRIVNARSATAGHYLFVTSAIPARNDDLDKFNKGATYDVYNVEGGQYLFSFYIADFRGNKLRSFSVFDDMLFVQYRDSFVCYKFIATLR